MKRVFKLGLIGVIILSIITTGYIVYDLDNIFRVVIEKKGTEYLQLPVRVEKVKVNILKGHVEVNSLEISNPPEYQTPYFTKVERMDITMDLSSTLTNHIMIKEISIQNPTIILESNLQNSNFLEVIKNLQARVSQANSDTKEANLPSQPARYIELNQLKLENLAIKTKLGVVEANMDIKEVSLNNVSQMGKKTKTPELLLSVFESIYSDIIKENITKPNLDVDKTLDNIKGFFEDSFGKK
jgi:uncharacterized protein involved in outer membrane biogenesis